MTRQTPFGYPWPGGPFIDQDEARLVVEVLAARSPSRFFGVEPLHLCDRFEKEFSAQVGARYGVAVGSGTGALHVALTALGLGPGQEAIIPAYLWVSVAAAVVQRGAIPVLCEVDDSYCLDPADVRRKLTPRTRVIIHIHMSGATGNLQEVRAIARQHGAALLEDCAQAVGGSYKGRPLGSFGDLAIFSFQHSKALSTGEGGMVVTSDHTLYKRCQAAYDVGHSVDFERGGAPTVLWGLGTVMTELQAALGLVQLRKLPAITGALRAAKCRLREQLSQIPGLMLRRLEDSHGDNGSFLLTRYPDAATAAAMARRLVELGLVCGPHGQLVHYLPDWGFHIYYNIQQLTRKLSNSPDGFPWTHPANRAAPASYDKGTLPRSDELFARSVLQAVPSDTTAEDAEDMIRIYKQAAAELIPGSGAQA